MEIPAFTANHILKRLRFCQWLRKNAKFLKRLGIMLSDEKIFSVNGGLNKQNNRVYCRSRQEADKNGG